MTGESKGDAPNPASEEQMVLSVLFAEEVASVFSQPL
jgi:hypothetical protein